MKVFSIKNLVRELRGRGRGIVLVGGTFDLIHPDHIEFLEKSKKLGKILVVCITKDREVRERKGPTRPIYDEKSRAKIVSALCVVDYVFVSKYSAYDKRTIELIKPDIVTFSLDGGRANHRQGYRKSIEKLSPGIKVKYVNTTGKFSTTKTIGMIVKKNHPTLETASL